MAVVWGLPDWVWLVVLGVVVAVSAVVVAVMRRLFREVDGLVDSALLTKRLMESALSANRDEMGRMQQGLERLRTRAEPEPDAARAEWSEW